VAWIRPIAALDGKQQADLAGRLRLRCEEQLSRVKRPVEFRFVARLPRTATGKVLRRRLPGSLIPDVTPDFESVEVAPR
jgi:acyl-coenzyme A synthetase/AMP-(fatty) acid ligase